MLIRISFLSIMLESPAESESNLESDSDGSEDDTKERGETEADSDTERTPQMLAKTSLSTHKASKKVSGNCSLLNLQIIKPPSLPSGLLNATAVTSLGAMSNHSSISPSFSFATLPGNKSVFVNCDHCQLKAFRKVLLR